MIKDPTKAMLEDVRQGRFDALDTYIGLGADVNEPDSNGTSVLMHVALRGSEEDVARVLEAGANPDRQDEAGMTALMWAALYGRDEVMRSIIRAGGNVNLADVMGRTAAFYAAGAGRVSSLKVLEECGAAVGQPDRKGVMPQMLASREGRAEVLEYYLQTEDIAWVNAPDHEGNTSVHRAVAHNSVDCLRLLIEKGGADVGRKNNRGQTPSDLASSNEVQRLLGAAPHDSGAPKPGMRH